MIGLINCKFYCVNGDCTHLERGRGFLWMGKTCVLNNTFPSACSRMINRWIPPTPPAKPPKSTRAKDKEGTIDITNLASTDINYRKAVRIAHGDVVVLSTPQRISTDTIESLRAALSGVFPSNKIVVLENGATLDVLRPEQKTATVENT